MLKTIIYINISIIVLVGVYSVTYKVYEVYERNLCVSEMREMAEKVEDRITYELGNSIGIKKITSAGNEKFKEKSQRSKYKDCLRVRKILYSTYFFEDSGEEFVSDKAIEQKYGNIYITGNGDYQIGNKVKSMYIMKKYLNEKKINFLTIGIFKFII